MKGKKEAAASKKKITECTKTTLTLMAKTLSRTFGVRKGRDWIFLRGFATLLKV